ncbi:hypothetical protein CCR75_003444 [Bremia lactucae]|uniref:Uncharacterized protein n=1 Tax=Bremia lactucae TaxID=4779 RepID=A0A976FJE4_BRELC|nr:hypothetical protein CCR75_003444 [Bremia lactucae]
MRDNGVLSEQECLAVWAGCLGIHATFNKRHITLAPVVSCVGLAVDVKDPQILLKDKGQSLVEN